MEDFLSTEEKLRRVQRQFPLWVSVITKAVVAHYGEEGSRLIRDALYQHGKAQGERSLVQKVEQKAEWSLRDIVEELRRFPTVMGFTPQDPEVVALSPTRAVLRFHHCPYPPLWKVVEAPPKMCEIWGSWSLGFYRTFNPRLKFTVLTTKHRGAEYCEEVWELE